MKLFTFFALRLADLAVISIILAFVRPALADDNLGVPRPNLTGTVQTTNGQPISNAAVFIDTAAPKRGPSTLCPSCYADCVKHTVTDAQGKFVITSLDPDLLFRILVVAGGFEPRFVGKVDPALKPLLVTLKPQLGGQTPDEKLTGQVVGPDGKPISGAVVNIRGVTRGSSTRFGGNDDVDPVAVSDADGNFLITSRKPFDAVGVDVEARGFATGVFPNLASGGAVHTLKLTEGALLKGRVVKNGEPMADVEITVSGAEREASVYAGNFSVATDTNGDFLFVNLPPQRDYVLCGTMKSLGARGCIPARTVSVEGDSETTDVGDVNVEPAFVVAGQIRLTDGKPLPAHERVQLSRENAWDFREIQTDKNGYFRFVGVPPEVVSLAARVPGYRFSLRNGSLDAENMFALLGRVVGNKTNLVLEFEPGKNSGQFNPDWETRELLQQEPLRGTEAVTPSPNDIKVTGTVVDADTQRRVPAFTVIEGRKSPYGDQINWLFTRQSAQSNGIFTVYLRPQPEASPAISVEANGYLPQVSGLILTGGTNFIFALKKGNGRAGVVLQPNGRPATNVAVYLADAGRNGVYAQAEGKKLVVRENLYPGTRKTLTDGTGHFSFLARPDDYAVVVIDPSGFAEVPVADLVTNHEVRLQKYARVDGRLKIGSRPGSNETVDLDMAVNPDASYPRDIPVLSLYLQTQTDGDGRFVFQSVPPIAAQVCHQPKISDATMGLIPQSQTTTLFLQPGKTQHITLGGKGRPVVGRLVVEGYDGKIDYREDVQTIETIVPPLPGMPDLTAMSQEFSAKLRSLDNDKARKAALEEHEKQWQAAREKLRAFYQTDAGRRYFSLQHRYVMSFLQDGSFRIEDVPGGKYNLRIELHEAGGGDPFTQPLIGSLTREITVPDAPGGRSDKPFDLGALDMTARHVLKVGKPAPDFEVKTLDGKPLKLSGFKGKYVLLDFWATWCGPCVGETPNLKATWEAFKNDPHFAMVSLSLDPQASAPRNFAARNGIGWTQGFLGDWSKSDVPDRFGVDGIPAIFLIGPDGKIVARDLRGEAIKRAVANALQNK